MTSNHSGLTYGPPVSRWVGPCPGEALIPKGRPIGPALRRLYDLIADTPTPCKKNPGLWVSEHEDEQVAAARMCATCPLLDACRDALNERGARWSGVTLAGHWTGNTEATPGRDWLRHSRHNGSRTPYYPPAPDEARESGPSRPAGPDPAPAYDPPRDVATERLPA